MSKSPYLVTARKYRPQRFSELIAQEHVEQGLKNALRLGRIAHAYLFTGPRGVGKTTAARILAKAINCTGNQDGEVEPCLRCPSCDDFETQRSLSIFEIDAASNNKVEDIRELRENVRIPPQEGRRKVYIVDEVHMLSNAAFNALLKTLEEPPPHVLFIFATTEPHKVLPTILSRCQRFDFRRIPAGEIVTHLATICKHEGIRADDDALHLIAHKGDGALRDALSVFDQAVALCGSDLQYSILTSALRVVDADLYFEATRYIADRATGPILRLAEKVVSGGYDIREFLDGLAEHTRNLLVASTLGADAMVDISGNLRERYAESARTFTETTLLRLLMVMDETQARLPLSSAPRLTLELALVKMTRMADSVDLSEALKQIQGLKQSANGVPRQPHETQTDARTRTAPAPPVHTPPEQKNTSDTETAARQPRPGIGATALGGKPALTPRRGKTNAPVHTGTAVQNHQSRTTEPVQTGTSLQENWNRILARIEQHREVQGSGTLRNSKAMRIHEQVLEIAVPNTIVKMVTQNHAMRSLIKGTMQIIPEFAHLLVQFIVRPDLFPELEITPDAEFQKLKENSPVVQQLDAAFRLRMANPPA